MSDTVALVPTRPIGDNSNAAASTAFVQLNSGGTIPIAVDPTGTNDNASALSAALAALTGTGGLIRFPPGKFKFNSLVTCNLPAGVFSVGIIGSGQDNTVLYWPNSSGLQFNYAGYQSSVHIRDLSITTGNAGTNIGLNLNQTTANSNPAVTAISDLFRVTFRGDPGYGMTDYWATSINVANVSNINFESVLIDGPATPNGNGIVLVGLPGSATYGVGYNIAKSILNNLGVGIVYGSYIQGVTLDQTSFTCNNGTSQAIQVPGSQTGTLAYLAATNCQFNVPTIAISAASPLTNILLSNNLFFLRANAAGIVLSGCTNYQINGNQMFSSSLTGTVGIALSGTSFAGTISGNLIEGANQGMTIGASITDTIISNNYLLNNTTSIVYAASGTTNIVINNAGYNPVGVSNNTMGSSPFTYTAGPSPETHYVRSAGSISSITLGGQTIATAALANDPITIHLGPNESYVTTWTTTAPTYVRSIH